MRCRHVEGKGLIKFLFAMLFLAGVGAVAWVWYVTGDPTKKENWRTGMEEGKRKLLELRESTWGEGGLVDTMADWLERQRLTEDGDAGASAGAGAAGVDGAAAGAGEPLVTPEERERFEEQLRSEPTADTLRLEVSLREAQEHFHKGYTFYQGADPKFGVSEETFELIAKARREFETVRDILHQTIGPYGERSDHDPTKLADAERLQRLNQRCLARTIKMGK